MIRIVIGKFHNKALSEYLIDDVVKLIKRKEDKKPTVNKYCGAWVWEIEGISQREYRKSYGSIGEYLDKLYREGQIEGYAYDFIESERRCSECGTVMAFRNKRYICPNCSFRQIGR